MRRPKRSTLVRGGALLAVALLALGACGGSDGGSSAGGGATSSSLKGYGLQIIPTPKGDPHDPDAGVGAPKRGGKVTISVGSEDPNGYCLPEAQLDQSGQQVARIVYDSLVRRTADGKFVPYLAKTIDHDADYTTWTITLRPNIKFSDGSALTAQVVKNNLDAYRGAYPGINSPLGSFTYADIATVAASGPLTVTVTMKAPWKDFPTFLYSRGAVGIMGQAQLDDPDNCAKNLIGTGPFELSSWKIGERYVFTPNPHYWRTAPNGKKLPYLSELDVVPIPDTASQLNSFRSGETNVMRTPVSSIIAKLRDLATKGKAQVITSVRFTGVAQIILNASKAPFNDPDLRRAANLAIDYAHIRQGVLKNVPPLAAQPFAPGNIGYSPRLTRIAPDMAEAKKLVAAYTKAHGTPRVVVGSTSVPSYVRTARVVAGYLDEAGFDASAASALAGRFISDAVAGTFTADIWATTAGVDPGSQYNRWKSGSPANFSRIDDPIIDCLLEVGRRGAASAGCLSDPKLNASYNKGLPKGFKPLHELDPANAHQLYEALSREFRRQAWTIWGFYVPWTFALKPDVHGVFASKNPDGSAPFNGLSNGINVATLWVG